MKPSEEETSTIALTGQVCAAGQGLKGHFCEIRVRNNVKLYKVEIFLVAEN